MEDSSSVRPSAGKGRQRQAVESFVVDPWTMAEEESLASFERRYTVTEEFGGAPLAELAAAHFALVERAGQSRHWRLVTSKRTD